MSEITRRQAVRFIGPALALIASPLTIVAQPAPAQRQFVAAREVVKNRGRPPIAFLSELVEWGQGAEAEIFAPNQAEDIYSRVRPELGPWQGERHRRAVMLEVLRVLGGFESSWTWTAGVDTTNPNSNTFCTEEAGIFQCSGDSMAYSAELRQLVVRVGGDDSCDTFRRVTKQNHIFAFEYTARLLRITVNHHGPVKYGHINGWLRRSAVDEFLQWL